MNQQLQENFENQYLASAEPWDYQGSGAEKLRYRRVLELARKYVPKPQQVLDVGCSLGQFTVHLADYSPKVWAIDIAPTAVKKCKENISKYFQDIDFQVATLSDVELAAESLDVIFYCDGIHAHELKGEILEESIKKTHFLLKKTGIVIFTDYLHYRLFEEHRQRVASFKLQIVHEEYLHDRLWFQVKSTLKAVSKIGFVRNFLASENIAQKLAKISALRGSKGSKHICFVAQK